MRLGRRNAAGAAPGREPARAERECGGREPLLNQHGEARHEVPAAPPTSRAAPPSRRFCGRRPPSLGSGGRIGITVQPIPISRSSRSTRHSGGRCRRQSRRRRSGRDITPIPVGIAAPAFTGGTACRDARAIESPLAALVRPHPPAGDGSSRQSSRRAPRAASLFSAAAPAPLPTGRPSTAARHSASAPLRRRAWSSPARGGAAAAADLVPTTRATACGAPPAQASASTHAMRVIRKLRVPYAHAGHKGAARAPGASLADPPRLGVP